MAKKQDKSISVWDDIAEVRSDPEYMREYEALKDEFAEIRRQIRAKDARHQARRAWGGAQLARVREFWAICWRHGVNLCRVLIVRVGDFLRSLTGGLDRVA